MGTDISSMIFVIDRVPFPGKPVENDLYRVDLWSAPPSCGIDVEDGTDGQATGGIQRSHSTFEVGL